MSSFFQFLLILSLFSQALEKYVVTYSHEPYSSCNPSSNEFAGLDITYTQILMSQLNLSQNFQFLCVKNISDSSNFPNSDEILFFIGGISDSNIDNFLDLGMKPSLPIISSGISILLYKSTEFWVFFRQFSWETIFLMILFPLLIGILLFYFEKKRFALEDYLWTSYSALFLMNNLKIKAFCSRIMLFSLWIMGFIIWVFCFAGAFSTLYLRNPIFQIKNAFDFNDKLVLTHEKYSENVLLYGGKVKILQNLEMLTLNDFRSIFIRKINEPDISAIVLEDPLAGYIENLDNDFLRVDANFFPVNFYLIFPENVDSSFEKTVNEKIMVLRENNIGYENINPSFFNRKFRKSVISMNFIDELLIIMGISLAICVFCNIFSRFIFRTSKIENYLVEKKLLNICAKLKEKQDIFVKKPAQILSIESLKLIIENEISKITSEIKIKLEIMADKINRFYDIILTSKSDILNILEPEKVDSDEKITRKNKKPFTFPSITKGFRKSVTEKDKVKKKSVIMK